LVQYRIIEPRINNILKRLNVKSVNLETISNFKLKEFILGSVPGRLGGIKAYDRNTDRDEIVIDVEVIYAGDARVRFSVQGWDCEINAVNFRAIVRMVFKPLMEALPIVGGLELYLISMPSLDYNLGGMAIAAEFPGISNIIRGILDKIIKKGFVWPNRLNLYLPLNSVTSMEAGVINLLII
jgi:Ca2+-dependent lipid-binding protein